MAARRQQEAPAGSCGSRQPQVILHIDGFLAVWLNAYS
jgi:hypothetical protein